MPHGSQTKRVKRVELLIGEKRDKDLETHEGLAVEEEEEEEEELDVAVEVLGEGKVVDADDEESFPLTEDVTPFGEESDVVIAAALRCSLFSLRKKIET
jgi:hypothetical protein